MSIGAEAASAAASPSPALPYNAHCKEAQSYRQRAVNRGKSGDKVLETHVVRHGPFAVNQLVKIRQRRSGVRLERGQRIVVRRIGLIRGLFVRPGPVGILAIDGRVRRPRVVKGGRRVVRLDIATVDGRGGGRSEG